MKLKSYLLQHLPFTKIWNEYNNPFYIWWKCRKYFKFPRPVTRIGKIIWFFGMPIKKDYYNRLIDLRLSAVGWKWKYERIDFEWNPYIAITLFRKWQWSVHFNYGEDSHIVWECMLNMVYNNDTLREAVYSHIWVSEDKTYSAIDYLTLKGLLSL